MRMYCILPERSQYQVLHHFTRKVAEALQRLGHQAELVSPEACLAQCQRQLPDRLLSFNGAIQQSGIFLCDILDIPHDVFLVDLPYYYLGLVESSWIRIFCDDEESVSLLSDLGYSQAGFFTQGVEPDLYGLPEAERPFPIVFFASFFDMEQALEQLNQHYSKELCTLIKEAVNWTFEDDTLSLPRAFEKLIVDKQHLLQGIDFNQFIYVMSYLQKGLARIQLVQSIQHLPVHVWDGRWKDHLKAFSNLTVHEAVDYMASLEILKQSKLVLCNSIRSVKGCNERVLNALACGAVPVTNSNPYFREHFEKSQDLVVYSQNQLQSLEGKLQLYLNNEQLRQNMVRRGYQKVIQGHTWDMRLKKIYGEEQNEFY